MKTNLFLIVFMLATSWCFTQNAQVNGNFESGPHSGGYEYFENNDYEINCISDDFSNFDPYTTIPTNQYYTAPVSLAAFDIGTPNSLYDPTLLALGVQLERYQGTQAIQLNPRNADLGSSEADGNATVLIKDLGMLNNPTLAINFAFLFRKHDQYTNPITGEDRFLVARFDVLDASNNVKQKYCIYSDHPAINPAGSHWYYLDWSCLEIDVSDIQGPGQNGKLRVLMSDCNKGNDGIMYIDDIGNDGSLCIDPLDLDPSGGAGVGAIALDYNSFTVCPDEVIEIGGSFDSPSGGATINLIFTPLGFGAPIVVATEGFTGGGFSFSVDLGTLNLDETLDYEISVTIDGTSITDSNTNESSSPDITFRDDCDSPCDPPFEMYIDGNNNLVWSGDVECYDLEFITNGRCCPKEEVPFPPKEEGWYGLADTQFSLGLVYEQLGTRCFLYRIRACCGEWSDWCCILSDEEDGSELPSDTKCYEKIPREVKPKVESINLYPNPFTAEVQFSALTEPVVDIKVFSVDGKLILEDNTAYGEGDTPAFHLNNAPVGVYIVKMTLSNGEHISKYILKE